MKKTITMSMEEYYSIIEENEQLKQCVTRKGEIVVNISHSIYDVYFRGGFQVFTKDKLISILTKEIGTLNSRNSELSSLLGKLNYDVIHNYIKRKWWHIF